MDLNRIYDWLLAEEMKEKFCTLDEVCFSHLLMHCSYHVHKRF